MKNDAMPDWVDLTDFNTPIRDVLVGEAVVVLRVQGSFNWFVVFVPDKLGNRPASYLNLIKYKKVSRTAQSNMRKISTYLLCIVVF